MKSRPLAACGQSGASHCGRLHHDHCRQPRSQEPFVQVGRAGHARGRDRHHLRVVRTVAGLWPAHAADARGQARSWAVRIRSVSTNSLRVVMLICLVTLFCSRRTIRRVASYVRQQVSSGSSSDESMRPAVRGTGPDLPCRGRPATGQQARSIRDHRRQARARAQPASVQVEGRLRTRCRAIRVPTAMALGLRKALSPSIHRGLFQTWMRHRTAGPRAQCTDGGEHKSQANPVPGGEHNFGGTAQRVVARRLPPAVPVGRRQDAL